MDDCSLQKKSPENHLHGMDPKHLYMTLCQRCHAAKGDGLGVIQPNLANFPRVFWKNGEFFRRVPDERMIKSIAKASRNLHATLRRSVGDDAVNSSMGIRI